MESPFAQYLHANYAPSDSELKYIRSHLIPHAREVVRLDALIADLSAKRAKAQAYIDVHKALLSPARRLPPDVVQEIFLACLPTKRNAVMSAKETPLLLTTICRAWRALALGTPALWASLTPRSDSSSIAARDRGTCGSGSRARGGVPSPSPSLEPGIWSSGRRTTSSPSMT